MSSETFTEYKHTKIVYELLIRSYDNFSTKNFVTTCTCAKVKNGREGIADPQKMSTCSSKKIQCMKNTCTKYGLKIRLGQKLRGFLISISTHQEN